MNSLNTPQCHVFTALPCEAKAIIEAYKLKKETSIHAFSIFRNDNILLTVTSIGKTAMAAGVAFTQALFPADNYPVMLNVGIAGHCDHPVGSVFLADKITDGDSGRRYYPPIAFSSPCATHSLVTFAKPQNVYPQNALCDMEASAFYEIAARFSTGELVQCVKIVSDNTSAPVENITPAMVSTLIESHLPVIDSILSALKKLAAIVAEPKLPGYEALLARYRFTANEQIQLKKLMSRWYLMKRQKDIDLAAASGKQFLLKLKEDLEHSAFYL